MSLAPFVTFVRSTGKVGSTVQILGQRFTGSTAVTFNGVAATSFSAVSDTYMTTVVPTGATTGLVVVTAPGGTLTSNVNLGSLNELKNIAAGAISIGNSTFGVSKRL